MTAAAMTLGAPFWFDMLGGLLAFARRGGSGAVDATAGHPGLASHWTFDRSPRAAAARRKVSRDTDAEQKRSRRFRPRVGRPAQPLHDDAQRRSSALADVVIDDVRGAAVDQVAESASPPPGNEHYYKVL